MEQMRTIQDIEIIQKIKEHVAGLSLDTTYEPRRLYRMELEKWLEKADRVGPFHREDELSTVYILLTTAKEKGAPINQIVRIAQYGMVVVDTDFYVLDWWTAMNDLGIPELWGQYCSGYSIDRRRYYRDDQTDEGLQGTASGE